MLKMQNYKEDKSKITMGLGNILKKGLKGIASVVINEVSSSTDLATEMEKYSDE